MMTYFHKWPTNIRERKAAHEAAILHNKALFDQFFLPENWDKLRPFSKNKLKGMYPTKKTFHAGQDYLLLAEILKQHFDYSPTTNALDVIFHFKRMYDKLYLNF